ncbi:hypothetical protein PR001_g29092 [Phytophthora rubi]|nr:hypothetical protein PR001_g29092 [Phytophthora rubi]
MRVYIDGKTSCNAERVEVEDATTSGRNAQQCEEVE